MVALSNVEEDILKSILERFVKNDNNSVKITYGVFPQYTLNNILCMFVMISQLLKFVNIWYRNFICNH